MTSLTERRKAILFLILAAILWSTAGVFVKALDWGPVSILAGRGLFTSIVFLLYLRRLPTTWSRWMVLAAGASIATQFLFITSTKLTTAANSIFLQYTAPIYVVLLAYWLLREKPSRTDWVAMGIIFLGLLLFFGDQLSTEGLYGNILAVISGVTAAIMMVAFRAQKDSSPEDSVLLASLLIAIFGFPSILKESWTVTDWLSIAYLGVIQIGIAFILFTKGIKHIPDPCPRSESDWHVGANFESYVGVFIPRRKNGGICIAGWFGRVSWSHRQRDRFGTGGKRIAIAICLIRSLA